MAIPVLTKKQQKQTLSAKKKVKGTIKNVLASPYDSYWPELSNEDNDAIKPILEVYLPRVKGPKLNVPWDVLKLVPKAERKQFRIDYNKDKDIEVDKKESAGMVFGVNDVTKLLETEEALSVLVSSDVDPRLMVKHVIDQCVLNNVPVLVVTNLRNILKTTCGLSSVVVGFKRCIHIDWKLNFVLAAIIDIVKKYPVKSNHINYHRSKDDRDVICVGSQTLKKKMDEFVSEVKLSEIKRNVYLIRGSKDKRVFEPGDFSKKNSADFISLGNNQEVKLSDEGAQQTPSAISISSDELEKSFYKPLVVKRLQGNPNRNKRKIDMLKKKKRRVRKKKAN